MIRLPIPGDDADDWGELLNNFLKVEHNTDGTLKLKNESYFEPALLPGQANTFLRGDKTWHALDKTSVGLASVDNTADIDKPVSTATQAALDGKIGSTGGTVTGDLTMQAMLRMSQRPVRGYIDATTYVDLAPGYVMGGEAGWIMPQARLTNGRFDIDSFQGKAEIRTHGSPEVNFYDVDKGQYIMQIDTSRNVSLFGSIGVNIDPSMTETSIAVRGSIGNGAPDSSTMLFQAIDERWFGQGVGGGIGFSGRYDSSGDYASFASIHAVKENATSGNYAAGIAFATRQNGQPVSDKIWMTGGGALGVGIQSPQSTLHVSGSVSTTITTVTGNYTLTSNDSTVLINATNNAVQLTLPDASSCLGRTYTMKRVDGSSFGVIVVGTSGQTIDGQATASISMQWHYLTVQSNGVSWYIVAQG